MGERVSDCNYCKWHAMKGARKGYRIAQASERAKVWDNAEQRKGGKFSQTFGSGVVIVDREGNFVCWFMELPERCAC